MFADGNDDGFVSGAKRRNKGTQKRERNAAHERAQQEEEARMAPVTCARKLGEFPEWITVGGISYFRVKPGETRGGFKNGTSSFVYYLSQSGRNSQQQMNVSYKYPHLSVEFDQRSQSLLSAHWTPVERTEYDDSNPHVCWHNREFGFVRNWAMQGESWELAVATKDKLREALEHFGMRDLPDAEPD